jgi:putative transposase
VKKRFSEEQIIGFLREAEAGMPVKDLCRKHGFSEAPSIFFLPAHRCCEVATERPRCRPAQYCSGVQGSPFCGSVTAGR